MSLKQRFNDLEPKRKKIVIWSCVGIIFLILVSTGYNSSRTDISERIERKKTREIQLEPDMIEKTMLREQRRQLESLQNTVDKIIQEQKKPEQANTEKALPVIPTAEQVTEQAQVPMPSPEEQPWPLSPERTGQTNLSQHPKPEPRMIGEISVLSNPASVTEKLDSQNNKKKEGQCISPLPLWKRSC